MMKPLKGVLHKIVYGVALATPRIDPDFQSKARFRLIIEGQFFFQPSFRVRHPEPFVLKIKDFGNLNLFRVYIFACLYMIVGGVNPLGEQLMSHLTVHKHRESNYLHAYKALPLPVRHLSTVHGISTTVEESLQINPFMQNKAKFLEDQMDVSTDVTRGYGNKLRLRPPAKQSQTKPMLVRHQCGGTKAKNAAVYND